MLTGERAHGIGAGGGTVGGGDGRAIELGNLEQILAGPQLALELAELLDGFFGLDALGGFCHGGLGLLIELLSHTISLISQAEHRRRVHDQFAQLPALYPARTKRNATSAAQNVLSYSPMR